MTLADAIESLTRYSQDRRPTGQFLEAVLANDLNDAVSRADDESVLLLRQIMQFVYCRLPGNAWGSREKVRAWLAAPRPGQAVEP